MDKQLVRIFFTGMLISALGTLPLGTLNIAAMQISVSEGVKEACYFALGVALVEIAYVRVSLVGINWIRKQKKLFYWMEWLALLIVVALAFGSFWAAAHPGGQKNVILQTNMHRFLLGMSMSAINPVQIPFWFGWSTVLFTKGVLKAQGDHYNYYITGIGLGTLTGISIFIFGGRLLVNSLNAKQTLMNYIIGGVFSLTAIIQLIKIFRHKGVADTLEEKASHLPVEMTGKE